MMSRGTRPRVVLALVALLLGLWIALVPFDRPLPTRKQLEQQTTHTIDISTPVATSATPYFRRDIPTQEQCFGTLHLHCSGCGGLPFSPVQA